MSYNESMQAKRQSLEFFQKILLIKPHEKMGKSITSCFFRRKVHLSPTKKHST
jgi:hypothetical protein